MRVSEREAEVSIAVRATTSPLGPQTGAADLRVDRGLPSGRSPEIRLS